MAILSQCPACRGKRAVKNKFCKCGENLDKAKRSGRVRYWIAYRLPGGQQRMESAGFTIRKAKDAEGKRRSQKREGRIFEMLPEARTTFRQLTDWYLGLEKVKALPSFGRIKMNLESFNAEFGLKAVKALRPAALENYQYQRKSEGYSDAYIDQQVGVVATMANKAFDNDMIGAEAVKAFRRVKRLLRPNGNARDQIIAPTQFAALMEHLPAHAKPVVATAYYTGMRSGEIFALTWEKVNLREGVICLEGQDTKGREPRLTPICAELSAILSGLPRGLHDNHVFLRDGKPMKKLRHSFKRACEKAGMPFGRQIKGGVTFHDLRHTFNTNMRRAGVPESVIMKITGHATRAMFDRYNTVNLQDAKEAFGKLSYFLESVDQTVDQKEKKG